MIPYIKRDNKIIFVIDGETKVVEEKSNNYKQILEAIRLNNQEKLEELIFTNRKIIEYFKGTISFRDNIVYHKNEPLHNYAVEKISQIINNGENPEPLLNFLEKLMQNPSKSTVDDLYKFLEIGNIKLHPDGDFIGFKAVTSSLKDKKTGEIDNSIGCKPKMDRNQVQDDPLISCSKGLHVGTREYAENFASMYAGDKIISVKVNPRDVVSVPRDEVSKLRCCLYEVIEVLN